MRRLNHWTSYFKDVLLEKIPAQDDHPELELFLRAGKLMLCSPSAMYSYEDKYRSFSFALQEINPLEKDARILVLGFGLGSIVHLLDRFEIDFEKLIGIDSDPRVLQLCKDYLHPDLLEDCELIEADAALWVHQRLDRFQLICVDLFIDTEVPAFVSSEGFLTNLMDLLDNQGQLIVSRLAEEKSSRRQLFERMLKKLDIPFRREKHEGNILYFCHKV
jgi:spermidine synthase